MDLALTWVYRVLITNSGGWTTTLRVRRIKCKFSRERIGWLRSSGGIVGYQKGKWPDRTAALVTDANRNRVAGIVWCLMMHATRAGALLLWVVCSRANERTSLGRKLRISFLSDERWNHSALTGSNHFKLKSVESCTKLPISARRSLSSWRDFATHHPREWNRSPTDVTLYDTPLSS